MATIKMCDRCHKLLPDDKKSVSALAFRDANTQFSKVMKSFDICEECKTQIQDMFKPVPDELLNSISNMK